MVTKSMIISRKFGLSNCYYFNILFYSTWILSEIAYLFFEKMSANLYVTFQILYLICCIASVYLLVGIRLIYIFRSDGNQFYDNSNVIDYVTFDDDSSNNISQKDDINAFTNFNSNTNNLSNFNSSSSKTMSNFSMHSNHSNYSLNRNNYNASSNTYMTNLSNSPLSNYNSPPNSYNSLGRNKNNNIGIYNSNNNKMYQENEIDKNPNNYYFNLALENMGH